MWTRKVTIAALVVAVAALVIWDICVASNTTAGDTISEVVLGFSRRVLTLPLAIGVVCGHLLWPARRTLATPTTFCILASVASISIVVDVCGHPPIMTVIPFAIGVGIGHFGWGQREG